MTQTTLDGSATPFIVPAGTNDIANDGDSLVLLGSIANLGTLTLNGSGTPPAGAPSPADIASLIVASPTVTLTGGGTLDMAANSDSFILGAAVQSTLINQDNTIEGEGLIGASGTLGNGVVVYPFALINGAGGVIDGNGTVPDTRGPPDGIEILTSTTASTMINDGLIEATNAGGVAIIADTIDQSGGGTLLATGSNDVVFLSTNGPNETDIVGGTLDVMNGGVIADIGTLDGSTSPVTIAAGSTMAVPGVMFGTIDNLGTLDAALGFGGYEGPYLTIDGPALTLTGGGSLLLANGTIIGAADALATLVNGGNTIAGVGVIGVASIDNTSIGPIGSAAPVALTNDSGGVVDAIGTTGAEFELVQFGGGAALVNAGLLEATQAGTLALTADTIFNTSGTILAAGAGAVVSLNTISLFGGQLASTGGGEILFGGGNNTLEAPSGEVGIAAGGTLDVAASATLALQTATLDNSGTFIDGGDLTLTGAGTTLNGGGGLALAGIIGGLAGTALINVDNTISGTGELSGGSLTNDAAGVIAGVGLNFASPVSNLGTLTNCSVGLTTATTIDNAGATLLANAGTIGLYNADIVGGMLLATNGGQIDDGEQDVAGGNTTLDGRNSAVTIAAGTTLTAWVQGISLPFYFDVLQNLTLLGTIELLGTIDATDTNPFGGGGTFTDNAVVVAGGSAAILGSVTNDGTLLTHSGTFTVGGDVNGVGTIDIAAGATFDLGAPPPIQSISATHRTPRWRCWRRPISSTSTTPMCRKRISPARWPT